MCRIVALLLVLNVALGAAEKGSLRAGAARPKAGYVEHALMLS